MVEYLTFQTTEDIRKAISLIQPRLDKNCKMGLRNTLRKFCVMKKVRDKAEDSEQKKDKKSKD
ncbi:MAG: hypothetical protein OEX79_02655 [Nitrosopumilus sp.]|nr:hypothetical protein [Nitrosopumilus sp.]MDH5554083.1 hypothetical protein [Nitrosopumilus sp.]